MTTNPNTVPNLESDEQELASDYYDISTEDCFLNGLEKLVDDLIKQEAE